jgi:pimeloyl-ACP methyl ester carboxylesterase
VLALALGFALPGSAAGSSRVVDLPVAFQVKNTNTSGVACQSDGALYVVRGHLVGPRAALRRSGVRVVTVYLYGNDTGGWNWRFTAVPGYDHPAELAKRGHVSLTIDMLGYGASGHPGGFESCVGSQADVAHQIVTDLRKGEYSIAGRRPIAFSAVVLAGHDVGGQIAEIEAYSYKDVDGLILVTWAEQGFTPFLQERFTQASARCAMGGQTSRPGGPGGYVFVAGSAEDFKRYLFHNADPAVIQAAGRLRQPNPCGYLPSAFPTGITTDLLRLREIKVPVLLALGANDPVFFPDGWALQKRHFTGSADVTSVLLKDTGHFPMLERTAPELRAIVADWLGRRGFVARRWAPS